MQNNHTLNFELNSKEKFYLRTSLNLCEYEIRKNQNFVEEMLFNTNEFGAWLWQIEFLEKKMIKIIILKEKLKMGNIDFNLVELYCLKDALEAQIDSYEKMIKNSENIENKDIQKYFIHQRENCEELLKKIEGEIKK